jgi:hypothetical protein
MRNVLIILLLLSGITIQSQAQIQLSEQAEIHILTCGPYQPELYSAFGHSAIRVVDPARGLDLLYNYGIFDFDQPNFYLNFARGFLHYKLGVTYYDQFRDYYIMQNRFIHEQVLNLTHQQKQELFGFLQWNALPENQYYYYDYFYDNCATRVRDALKEVFSENIRFDGSYINTEYTIRDLTDLYLQEQPWGDLGIDLCLGLPMDVKATPEMYMFLPDYIEQGFDHAYIRQRGTEVPLVKETLITYESTPEPDTSSFIKPMGAFLILLVTGFALTLLEINRRKHYRLFDVILFGILGLLGWLLLSLWLFTDHSAAARNMNLLWAIPFYVPVIFWLYKEEVPRWVRIFFITTSLIGLATLIMWAILPQDLHDSLIPVTLLAVIRGLMIGRFGALRSNGRQ